MSIDLNQAVLEVTEALKRNGITKGRFLIELDPTEAEKNGINAETEIRIAKPLIKCRFVPPLGFDCNF